MGEGTDAVPGQRQVDGDPVTASGIVGLGAGIGRGQAAGAGGVGGQPQQFLFV